VIDKEETIKKEETEMGGKDIVNFLVKVGAEEAPGFTPKTLDDPDKKTTIGPHSMKGKNQEPKLVQLGKEGGNCGRDTRNGGGRG